MDENKWKGFVAVPETRELSCEGCALASSRDDDPTRVRCNREDDTPRCCAENRKDGRQIIWVPAPVEEEQRPEPKVVFATVRDEFDSNGEESGWSLECRFDDGQKYGAVTVDRPFPELAHRICDFLNQPQEVRITVPEDAETWISKLSSLGPGVVLGPECPTGGKADRNGVTKPDMSAVEKYLKGAPTPDEIEALHATGYVLVKAEVWEATRAMAEAFVTEPEPGDPPEVWQEWAALVEKYRARYEELRGETP